VDPRRRQTGITADARPVQKTASRAVPSQTGGTSPRIWRACATPCSKLAPICFHGCFHDPGQSPEIRDIATDERQWFEPELAGVDPYVFYDARGVRITAMPPPLLDP
jgi:hypothetical protein